MTGESSETKLQKERERADRLSRLFSVPLAFFLWFSFLFPFMVGGVLTMKNYVETVGPTNDVHLDILIVSNINVPYRCVAQTLLESFFLVILGSLRAYLFLFIYLLTFSCFIHFFHFHSYFSITQSGVS